MLASDIPAFRRVLDDGELGVLFRAEQVDDLTVSSLPSSTTRSRRAALDRAAAVAVRRYDWSTVAAQVEQVYETVTSTRTHDGERP